MTHLTIAIDETGDFTQQKLLGTRKQSGVVAVAFEESEKRFKTALETSCERHGFNAWELHGRVMIQKDSAPMRRNNWTPEELSNGIKSLEGELASKSAFICGVHGFMPGRAYFHEQQAYGEMLMMLLWRIGIEHGEKLARFKTIELRICTRLYVELVGFADPHEYHEEFVQFVYNSLPSLGWPPSSQLFVRTVVGTSDNFARVADLFAFSLGRGDKTYSISVTELLKAARRPPSINQITSIPMAEESEEDAVVNLLETVAAENPPEFSTFDSLPIDAITEFYGRLAKALHELVEERFSRATLPICATLVDYLGGRFFDEAVLKPGLDDDSRAFAIELCTFAAQIASHGGQTGSSSFAGRWIARSDKFHELTWSNNVSSARAARLFYRCQTMHVRYFHVFRFEDAWMEMLQELESYEKQHGGASNIPNGDQLHAALLGTVGQALALIRSSNPDTIADPSEPYQYFERSHRHLADAEPYFQAMNLGFRVTELWDRRQLPEAEALMRSAEIPEPEQCDIFSLLHRLRLAALARHLSPPEPNKNYVTALLHRLETLAIGEHAAGAHPYDLALKWGLYLNPGRTELQTCAIAWLDGLRPNAGIIRATSLPLRLQLGDADGAREVIDDLLKLPAFAKYWELDRAKPLREAIEKGDCRELSYAALCGMPWYYA